jgi:hypothetical protein
MCRFPASGSSRESFAHGGNQKTPPVTRWSTASSAIRCRFVDRFARPKVLTPVARQRFSPRDAPLSSIGSRRDQFSDVISTMRALRLPTHASPVTYLFRFRGPRDSSSVRARRCQRSRAGRGPATGQDHCSAGDLKLPAYLHVDASGTSQVPRRPILCLCPVLRPRPNRRSLTNDGRIRCCPCCRESKGSSVLIISRLQRGFGTCLYEAPRVKRLVVINISSFLPFQEGLARAQFCIDGHGRPFAWPH